MKAVSAKENISDGPEGIILEAIIEGMSEYYSADLAVKVLRGMKENALKAKYNGGNYAFGYTIDENKHFKPDTLTAPIVVEIFQKYADGMTMKGIAECLKSKSVLTDKGRAIDQHRIRRMLSNRRYLGEYRFRDIVIPDAFEPIIPQSLFDDVQSRLRKNKKGAAKYKAKQLYLLFDKLFCGKCGAKMVGECGQSSSGATYYYYKCTNAKRRKCSKRSVRKQYIEDIVIQNIMDLLNDKPLVERIVETVHKMQSTKNTMLPFLEKQLSETIKNIGNMLNAIQSGVLTKSTKQRLEELEQSKKDTEIAILQEKIASPIFTKEQIEFWICKWREINPSNEKERKELIGIFVSAIYHYDNDMLIVFNHKDGEKMVTLDEVSASRSKPPTKEKCSDTVPYGSPATNKGEHWQSLWLSVFSLYAKGNKNSRNC